MKDKLSLSEIKIFVSLIDSGAPIKMFKNQLGLDKPDVDKFYAQMADYRKVLGIAAEMEKVRHDQTLTLQQRLRKLDKLGDQLPNG